MNTSFPIQSACILSALLIASSILQASSPDTDVKKATYTYELVQMLQDEHVFVKVSFNPHDETVLDAESCNRERITWSLSTGKVEPKPRQGPSPRLPGQLPSYKVAYNQQKTQYVLWARNYLALYNATNNKLEHTLYDGRSTPHVNSAAAGTMIVRYDASGKLFASGVPNYVLVWDTKSGKLLDRFKVPASKFWALAFNPQKDQLSFVAIGRKCFHEKLSVLNFAQKEGTYASIRTASENLARASCLEYSPDGIRLVALLFDYTIRILNPDTLACLQKIESPLDRPLSVAFQHDGEALAIGSWRGIRVFKKTSSSEAPPKPIIIQAPSYVAKEKEKEAARRAKELRTSEREFCLVQ